MQLMWPTKTHRETKASMFMKYAAY